ncbi:MAG: hypothetical protein ACK559_23590, partial [bacterium]
MSGLQKQQQAWHLAAARDFKSRHHRGIGPCQSGQIGLVASAAFAVAEQIGAGAQQFGPPQQGLRCKAVIGKPIESLLQGAQHGLGIAGRADTQQAEVIDRQ